MYPMFDSDVMDELFYDADFDAAWWEAPGTRRLRAAVAADRSEQERLRRLRNQGLPPPPSRPVAPPFDASNIPPNRVPRLLNSFDSDEMDDFYDAGDDSDFDAASRRRRRKRARTKKARKTAKRGRRQRQEAPSASTRRSLTLRERAQYQIGRWMSDGRVAPIARTVGPVLERAGQAIGSPTLETAGQIIGTAGDLLPADEFEAFEEMVNAAELQGSIYTVAPEIARLTLRNIMPGTAYLPPTTRRQLAQSITSATQTLAQQQGIQAARAIPQIVASVQRNAQQHRLPVRALPQAIQRTAARVANSPSLTRQLAQTASRGQVVR